MKFYFAGIPAITAFAAVLAVFSCSAQTTPAAPQKPAAQGPQNAGQVIFSRSSDDSGKTTTQVGAAAAQPAIQMATEPTATDAERQAVTFTALDLDVHLLEVSHQIAVRALLTVRNDGKAPLAHIPLQISSTLNWERIRVAGKDVSFPVATLNTDSDHTGQLHEAAVTLAQPLAPGASIQVDVLYSGAITPSAQRLLAVGAPEEVALHSDWDEISVPFTGLRGFGSVVWYPVSSVPAILGDGNRLFDEIGRQKLRLSGAHFRLRLAVEFPHGKPPTIALVNGRPVALTVTDARGFDPTVSGVATGSLDTSTVGFDAPSLFVAIRKAHHDANLTAWTTPEDEVNVETWTDAADKVAPFLEGWLGEHPRRQLTVLDLPDANDAPYETGALLAANLSEQSPDKIDGVLVHALAQAYAASRPQPPSAWLSDGLATFMDSLWIEKLHGREQALSMLEADRTALALAEPSSPGESTGQPLAQATSPVYYRTKAAYVLWMLRDLAGDAALSAALRAYESDPTAGAAGPSLQKLIQQAGVTRDLSWFFADWVDADKGLPDLSIQGVYPNAADTGTFLVAVSIANAGYAAAEVPLTVRTAQAAVTQRVLVPARGRITERVLVMGKPTEVQLDDGTVPETEASIHVTHLDQPTADSSSSQPNP